MFYMGGRVREYRQKVAPNLTAAEFVERVKYKLGHNVGLSESDLSKIENNKKALTMEKVMMLTITYEDKSLYFRFRQQEDEFVLGCFAEKKLISI